MALQQALGTNIPRTGVRLPPAAPAAPVTPPPDAGAEFVAQQQKAQAQLEPLQQQRAQLGAQELASKQQATREQGMLQQRQAEGEAGIQQQYAQRMAQAPQREMLQEKVQQEKDFFFRPSQEDGMMMASLASLVAVLGASIGRGGKANAQGALAAMNGMMQGYQQGRDDIFKKEKSAFETNLKALRDQMVGIRTALQDYERTVITDRDTATANLRAELAKQGADFKTAQIEREGPLKQIPVLDAQIRQLEKQIAGFDSKAADARTKAQAAADAAERRREQIELAASLRQPKAEKATVVMTPEGPRAVYPSQLPPLEAGATQVTPMSGRAAGTSAAADKRYAFNINESFAQAATDLLNVSQMPEKTVLGAFAGMTGQSGDTVMKSLANVFARKVTPEDARLMQQIVAGLDQNMARALGGGYATSTSKGLIQAYKEQVAQYGDSPLAQAMFLSRMKQELEVLAKAFKNHPGSNEGYVADMKEYINELQRAIPFTVQDVIAASRGSKRTITDKFSNLAQSPVKIRLPTSPSATDASKAAATTEPAVQKDKARPGEVVHQDAQGNKAVKRDGQWVEVQ